MVERDCVRILEEAIDFHANRPRFEPARDGKPGREKKRPEHDPALDMPRGRLVSSGSRATCRSRRQRLGLSGHQDARTAAEDLGPLADHEERDVFPRPRTIAKAARRRGWNVIDILGRSAGRFIEDLGYPEVVFGAFENSRKGEGADVEEQDIVDKKDKASGRS